MKHVYFRHPLCRASLSLERTPKYLRFVCQDVSGKREWDALDQPDDQPREGETLVAGVFSHAGTLHLDCVENGCRVGKWRETVTYEPVSEQPSQEVMRDVEKWREWCFQQEGLGAEDFAE